MIDNKIESKKWRPDNRTVSKIIYKVYFLFYYYITGRNNLSFIA